MQKAKVYFTREITPEALVRLYDAVGKELKGRVAVKLHSGEKGNQNYVRPEFVRKIIERVNGTVVECNTAYEGARNETAKHQKLMADHGWSKVFAVDIMDGNGEMTLPVKNGKVLKENIVGEHLKNYDSMLVLSHFKGHPMGGFGGALKQLSIGCASSSGKALIHSAGKDANQETCWDHLPPQDKFLESMADAASTVVEFFHGNIVYLNMMVNLSVDCDCCAVAEDPCMKDIGMVASLDPVAIDRACLDFVYASKDRGRDHFLERVESRHGTHTVDAAAELQIGTKEYELVSID